MHTIHTTLRIILEISRYLEPDWPMFWMVMSLNEHFTESYLCHFFIKRYSYTVTYCIAAGYSVELSQLTKTRSSTYLFSHNVYDVYVHVGLCACISDNMAAILFALLSLPHRQMATILNFTSTVICIVFSDHTRMIQKDESASIMSKLIPIYSLTLEKCRLSWILSTIQCLK